ncbi:hypothetical protein, partial [Marivivens sp.]|uniref:hypothetical protein n=1 Tax=Marivivens sp. TaxID=1978374 RepID=UPI0025C01177
DGYVSYFSAAANNQWIEIGKIDKVKNGSGGSPLRINLFADATIPGTSNILNGDFSATDQEIVGFEKNMVTVNAGSNGVTLTGAHDIGTGALTINSDGAVSLAAGVTAASLSSSDSSVAARI